ncbi:MAG: flagellar basal body L-ring protein FlgH [Betaproteobacteria bacterium]|nr:flagellar basal body L-ring protein FlgH [Betaproteobacteria bacterium]
MNTEAMLLTALLAITPGAAVAHAAGTQDSLINPATYRSLTADRSAHRRGDLLTVLVLDASSASAAANTAANNSVQLGATAQTPRGNYGGTLGFSGSDSGAGQTSRSGEVEAQLTVRVVDTAANGMLKIQGTQAMVVNGEDQSIRLTGWVRPEDISAANTVISSRISDARIEFTGRGDLSRAQRQGLLYRFAKWLGLI